MFNVGQGNDGKGVLGDWGRGGRCDKGKGVEKQLERGAVVRGWCKALRVWQLTLRYKLIFAINLGNYF